MINLIQYQRCKGKIVLHCSFFYISQLYISKSSGEFRKRPRLLVESRVFRQFRRLIAILLMSVLLIRCRSKSPRYWRDATHTWTTCSAWRWQPMYAIFSSCLNAVIDKFTFSGKRCKTPTDCFNKCLYCIYVSYFLYVNNLCMRFSVWQRCCRVSLASMISCLLQIWQLLNVFCNQLICYSFRILQNVRV